MSPHSARRLRLQAAAAFAGALVLLWTGTAYQIRHVEGDVLEAARGQGANLANVVAAHFAAFARDIDLRLRRSRARWTQDPSRFMKEIVLERSLAPDSAVLRIAIVDRNGRLAFSDPAEDGGRNDLDLADDFQVHQASGGDRLFIDRPADDRVAGIDAICFSRPILGAQGDFLGVIVQWVSAQELLRVYGGIELGRDAVVSIRRADGVVLVRSAGARLAAPPRPIPDLPELAAGRASGSFVRRSPVDGIERLHSFRRLTEPAVTVIAAQSLDTALSSFREQRDTYLIGGALISAALAALLALALATLRRAERADRQLRESEARLRSLIDLSSDFYWETDARHRVTVLSFGPRHRSVLPGPDDEWRGKTRWEISHLAPGEEGWRRHRAVLDAHEAFRDFEFSRRVRDGTVRDLLISGEPVFDADGRFFGYRGIGHDITVLRRAQEELRQSRQQRALLDSIPDAAWLKDEHGVFIEVNSRAAERCGRDRSDLIGRRASEFMPAAVAERWAQQEREAMESGKPLHREEFHSEDGQMRCFDTVLTPVIGENGHVIGVAGISRDVTETKLADARRIVNHVMQREALVKEVHHRIKNNLQGVISMVQRLALEHPGSAAVLESVIVRVNAVAAMHGLYGTIGGREFRVEQIVRNLVASLKTNHEALPLTLAIRSDASDLQVAADEVVPLALIINELIWNAVKHSRQGVDNVPVEIAVEGAGEQICIRIRNRTGRLPAQFDFEDRVGLGTGLALVKSLLPLRGAALRFENLANDGVEVELRLQPPVIVNSAAAARRPLP